MWEFLRPKLIPGLILGFIFLPLILWRLRRARRTTGRGILKYFLGFLFAVDTAGLIILLLIRFAGLEMEWRGGYVPVLTWNKTKPNFDALERSRAQQFKLSTNAVPAVTATGMWPGFRGPHQDGRYDESTIVTKWPTNGLPLLWKQDCGGGYSSFAIANGRAFTLEQRRDNEVLVAYDILTGRELWTNNWPALFTEYHSDEGPRSTPAYSDGKVYALGATGEFRCVEAATGKVAWSTNIVTQNHAALPDYGLSASPLVVDDKVILQPDAYHGNSVVCYDKNDGHIVWHSLDLPMGYATPMPITLAGEKQVVVCARPYIVGLRLSDGVERWRYNWPIINHERPITQPLQLNTNILFVSAAYMTGCAAFEIDKSKDKDGFEVHEVWRNKNLQTKFASAVLSDGYIYGFNEDILACVEAKTGERKWKDGRYGYGQLLLASGYLIVQAANGNVVLVKANSDKLDEMATFPALKGKSWNAPAIAGGLLLVRNNAQMACYRIGAAKPQPVVP